MTDIIEKLQEDWLRLSRGSFDSVDCGLAANVVDEAIDEIKRLREELARSSERIEALLRPAQDCYHIEGCPHWVEACTRYQRAEAQLAKAEKALRVFEKKSYGTALDYFASRASVSSPVTEKTDG